MVNYGKTLMSNSDLVQDCVQDVFADLWNYRTNLSHVTVVKAYLLSSVRKRIARLHQREHIFFRAKELDAMDFLLEFSVEDQMIADDDLRQKMEKLNKYLNNLPARQREALYLRYHQNLSVEEVSKILGINYQSTKNLLFRAIQQIRKDFPTYLILIFFSAATKC
jgi:RNA polymerase sigma factor (sigma-70 family)